MGNFKPTNVNVMFKEIYDRFMKGERIRVDGRGLVESGGEGNIGKGEYINSSTALVHSVIGKLQQEGYMVRSWGDQYSGCCQYHVTNFRLI